MDISDTDVVFGSEVQQRDILFIDCPGVNHCTVRGGLPHSDPVTGTRGYHLYTVVRRHPTVTSAICADENGGQQGWTSVRSLPTRIVRRELAAQAHAFSELLADADD